MADEGASPRELLMEACRRNNTSLLQEVLNGCGSSVEKKAALLNTARDGLGKLGLHVAAEYGSYEVLDVLLDQEGLEVDPLEPFDGDTPLHKAVRYTNNLDEADWEAGDAVVELLLDAGADPRVLNSKSKLKPSQMADPKNKKLREILMKAEYAQQAGGDVVNEDDDDQGGGSASDSD